MHPPNNSTGTTARTPGTDLICSSAPSGEGRRTQAAVHQQQIGAGLLDQAVDARFHALEHAEDATATHDLKKIRMLRPGLRQIPDQMSGRNRMRRVNLRHGWPNRATLWPRCSRAVTVSYNFRKQRRVRRHFLTVTARSAFQHRRIQVPLGENVTRPPSCAEPVSHTTT